MSFTWKRKIENKVSRERQKLFEEDVAENKDEELLMKDDIDWLCPIKRKCIGLEDSVAKSDRLKNTGCFLAEEGRHWEAINNFNEAIKLTPNSEILHELAAQAFMQLNEVFPAVSMAEKAVKLKSNWWVAYQTLGRAQLGIGEVKMALANFKKAIHLNPVEKELWEEDLYWAINLLERKELPEQLSKDVCDVVIKELCLEESEITITENEMSVDPLQNNDLKMNGQMTKIHHVLMRN